MQFKVDNDVKQEYLQTKPTATAESDVYVLKSFDDSEDKIGKQVYNFNHSELNEMFASLRNSSKRGVGKNKSILVTYVDFCISKRIVIHMENRARYIEIKKFVSQQATLNKYPSKEKLKEYTNMLYNEQDQLLMWLPFIGVRGRTKKGATMEEIINLTVDDVFRNEKKLILRNNDGATRELKDIDDFIFDLIQETYEQENYVENNGEMTDNPKVPEPRKSKINNDGEFSRYVFRVPGNNKHEKFNITLLDSRRKKIQRIINNRYITYTSLFQAGMIQLAINKYLEKGEVTKVDYVDICKKYNYGGEDPEKYWFHVEDLFYLLRELKSESLILSNVSNHDLRFELHNTDENNEQNQNELIDAISQLEIESLEEPVLTQNSEISEHRFNSKARSAAFRVTIKKLYNHTCAICFKSMRDPKGNPEVQSAHIYPKHLNGSDDLRNGLCLCRFHHWAFDVGWISVSDKYKVIVNEQLPNTEAYTEIMLYEGKTILLPDNEKYFPHAIFLKAHRELFGFR